MRVLLYKMTGALRRDRGIPAHDQRDLNHLQLRHRCSAGLAQISYALVPATNISQTRATRIIALHMEKHITSTS
jgi:hypothetical protein